MPALAVLVLASSELRTPTSVRRTLVQYESSESSESPSIHIITIAIYNRFSASAVEQASRVVGGNRRGSVRGRQRCKTFKELENSENGHGFARTGDACKEMGINSKVS
jgi:hypothetical protein